MLDQYFYFWSHWFDVLLTGISWCEHYVSCHLHIHLVLCLLCMWWLCKCTTCLDPFNYWSTIEMTTVLCWTNISIFDLIGSTGFWRVYLDVNIICLAIHLHISHYAYCVFHHVNVQLVLIHSVSDAKSKSLQFYAGPIFLFLISLVRLASD